MENFLTTRQLQSILKVDRITVYRMLQDGRLKGTKIGQQWRFHRSEVERLLNGLPAEVPAVPANAGLVFPKHCVETVLNLFSGVGQIGVVMVDPSGEVLTDAVLPCEVCTTICQSLSGSLAWKNAWQAFIEQPEDQQRVFRCLAGAEYLAEPVLDNGVKIGWLLVGPFYSSEVSEASRRELASQLALDHARPYADILAGLEKIKFFSPEQVIQLENWAILARNAVQSILIERSTFIYRLQQIAELTQLGKGAQG